MMGTMGRSSRALAFVFFTAALSGDAASAQSALASKIPDAAALRPADDSGRTRGVASLSLPFGLRARYEAQALDRLTPSHGLSAPYAEFEAGPSRRMGRLIDRRFALSCLVTRQLEHELAWTARTPLSMVDLLRVEDQRVAAMIRFVH